jgi:DNA-binding protein HU-beta
MGRGVSTLNSAELIDHVAETADVDKGAAKRVVAATLAGIINAAKTGEEVNLVGFGKFKVQERPARRGRNPATGEAIKIPASRKIGFTPAKQLRDAIAG